MTTEMLCSEHPWAVARTLMSASARAMNSRAEIPLIPVICDPTAARMLQSLMLSIAAIVRFWM